jgi:hypothetical protein
LPYTDYGAFVRNFVETTEKYHKNPWYATLRENLFAGPRGFAQLVSDTMQNNTTENCA